MAGVKVQTHGELPCVTLCVAGKLLTPTFQAPLCVAATVPLTTQGLVHCVTHADNPPLLVTSNGQPVALTTANGYPCCPVGSGPWTGKALGLKGLLAGQAAQIPPANGTTHNQSKVRIAAYRLILPHECNAGK